MSPRNPADLVVVDETATPTTLTPAGIGESLLVPALRPGQVVVLDNLRVHKSPVARLRVEAAGGRLVFLPTYAPDVNPIKAAFAKSKQALRRATPRSFDAVVGAVGAALAVTTAEARAVYRAAGYPARLPGFPLSALSSGAWCFIEIIWIVLRIRGSTDGM